MYSSLAMLDDIYNTRILELAARHPPDRSACRAGRHRDGAFAAVRLDRDGRRRLEGDVVTDFAHVVKACALGQASSSIMARHVVGASLEELRAARDAMRRMLKENGAPPGGRFEEARVLEPVRDYKARHASTLLTFDAVVEAVEKAQPQTRDAAE